MSTRTNRVSSSLNPTYDMSAVLTILAVSILIACFPGIASAQANQDSVAVRAQLEAYLSTWNTHDATALAAFFTEDADLVLYNLPKLRGRQDIQRLWQGYFARQEPERNLTCAVNSLRLISSEVALLDITTTTGGQDAQGVELPARKARGTWVLQRQSGVWLISALLATPTEEDSVVLTASIETAETLRPDIRVFVDAYEDAFNSHDASAVSAFYRNDADIIVRNGPLLHGTRAIKDCWRTYFSVPRPYRAILITDEIRIIAPDVALVDIIGTGAVPMAEGRLRPLRYTRAMWVLVREADKWLISALRVLPSEDDRVIRRGGN